MRVIFPPITIRLMVNVKALVFKNRLKKKKKKAQNLKAVSKYLC